MTIIPSLKTWSWLDFAAFLYNENKTKQRYGNAVLQDLRVRSRRFYYAEESWVMMTSIYSCFASFVPAKVITYTKRNPHRWSWRTHTNDLFILNVLPLFLCLPNPVFSHSFILFIIYTINNCCFVWERFLNLLYLMSMQLNLKNVDSIIWR